MSVPQITAAKFLESLERSGLVSDVELQSCVTQFDGATDEDAHGIARELVNRGVLTRYQAERLLAGESRGFFINRYRLLELLGAGGMSYLYLATDPDNARRVALKVVTRKYVNDEGMIARLKLEARAGQTIDHPNVVRSYEISAFEDVFGPNHYLAMEFVEGVNLEEFVQLNRTIPWTQVCDMGMQAAEGLRAAHRANVVHRDVKPANLLVDREGRLKLLDFGLALLTSRDETDEFSLAMIFGHDCLGTADFIAPEQAGRRSRGTAIELRRRSRTFFPTCQPKCRSWSVA
ncbi:MAG: serine/threonine-protein kinase [Planctomycetota bacterium]|nr:serine/threonine-protein kinase [Planctomycetota bacterium]